MDQSFEPSSFDGLLLDLLRRFINPPRDQVRSLVESALARAASHLGFDVIILTALGVHATEQRSRMLWQIPQAAEFHVERDFPWIAGQLGQGATVRVPDTTELPREAQVDRTNCQRHGVSSLHAVPALTEGETATGLVVCSTQVRRDIDPPVLQRMRVLGEILAHALACANADDRIAAAVESADAGLWSLDFATMTFWATEKTRAMHGLSPTDVFTLETLLATMHADDRERMRATFERSAASPENVRAEYRVLHPDGSTRWVAIRMRPQHGVSGEPQQLIGGCADVSDRKRVEIEMRNEVALTEAVFDSVPGLLYLYSQDGKLKRWNRKHEEMTGYNAAELLDFNAAAWFDEEELPLMQREWNRVFAEGHAFAKLNLKRKNGTKAPFYFTGVRVNIDGQPHLVGIGMDLSEQKKAEARLEQLRAEIAHATRVTTLGQLASALAHELTQPLAAILSNAQAARRWLARPDANLDEIRDILDDIIVDDKRAGEIIHRLRALMTRSESRHSLLDLNKVVGDVAGLLHSELVALDVPLVLDLQPDLPRIEAGEIELQQALLNLMINGLDAQRKTGPARRRLTVRTRHDGDRVVLAVSDHGTGITEGELPQLFEPFFSTKPQGLGMGLAICRRVAETHHAHLGAENNPGGGATFFLALPTVAGSP